MELTQTVKQFLRNHIPENTHIICAVSGGADSVCLLLILHALQKDCDISLSCVHVHHHIRGKEADEDAAFVEALCKEKQVPFTLKEADVPALADKSSHTGLEETARNARYQALFEEAERFRLNGQKEVRIATAHNQDDQAETVLMNLFRGTGLKGLSGMAEDNGQVIRPLLTIPRSEIEVYLRGQGAAFRTDRTNKDDVYTRNRVRLRLLDMVKKEINPRAGEHIADTALDLRAAGIFLERHIEEVCTRCKAESKPKPDFFQRGLDFSVRALCEEDPFLRSEVIAHALKNMHEISGKGSYYQIGRVHVQAVLKLLDSDNGRAVLELPGGVRANRLHGHLYLYVV